MHGMNDQVDMRRFGGLRTLMVITWATFGFGWLAIIGVPPFSGFWSKDRIIEAAFDGNGWRPWVFGLAALIGAGITAFYMSRLFFMTFFGKRRWTEEPRQHPHEAPALMTVPMIVLAVGSAGLGAVLGATHAINHWLEPVVGAAPASDPVISGPVLTVLTLVLIILGVALAWWRYIREPVPEVAPVGTIVTRAARQDLYQDAVNEALFMRPGEYLTRSLVFVDGKGVDGAVGGLAAFVGGFSARLRRLQTGFVRSYALTMLAGVVVVLGALAVAR
jgi:NADH-quinone oxidoreductase subunit L